MLKSMIMRYCVYIVTMLIKKNYQSVTMIKRRLFSILLITVLIASFAAALTASISNPRMVLYKNITDNLEFQNSVTVNNDNPIEVRITVKPIGVWEDKVTVSENDFVLKSGERKEVSYIIKLEKPGYYDGDILVTFYDEQNDLSLVQNLVVLVSDETGKVPQAGKTSLWIWVVSIAVLILLLVGLMILGNKKMKKGRKK